MAYDFLGLVNDICKDMGEVELSTSNFSTANGVYNSMKDAVNSSIRAINQQDFEWPWNHQTHDETLVAGTVRYSFPVSPIALDSGINSLNFKTADMDSFRIRRNDTFGNETRKLRIISYEHYLDKYSDMEYNTSTGIRKIPECVFRTPDNNYGVVPPPDNAYTLTFEYYVNPSDLSLNTDVPNVPEQFRYVIKTGALYFIDLYKNDIESADRRFNLFQQQIKDMRIIYINRYDYVRDTRVNRGNATQTNVLRVT